MSSRPAAHGFDILLVEDNPADIYLFRKALENAGVNGSLTVIEDGLDALRFARREGKYVTAPLPDLAVLDINLPQFSGLEVLEALRSSRDFHDVPVIIMTSSAQARERARAHGLGIDEFITKSPDLEEILQIGHVIKKLLLSRASTAKTNALPD